MKLSTSTLAAALASIAVVSSAGAATRSDFSPGASYQTPQLIFGRDTADGGAFFEQAQFLWSGRNYCFYDSGWRGPGYYWCGYAFRRGYGWGGPVGWNGWSWRHGGPGGYRGGGYGRGYGGDGRGDRGPVAAFHGGGPGGGHEGGGHGGGHEGGGGGQGGGHEGGGHEGHPH